MNWLFQKNNLIKFSGLTAITGMIIIFIADLKLLYMPLGLGQYSIFRAAMDRSDKEIILYSKIAVFAVPLVLLGLFHIYLVMKRTNKILAWITVSIFCYGYINAGFYYAYLGYVMNLAHILEPLKLKIPFFTEHIFHLFQLQYYGGIIVGSLLFFLGLSFFKHNFPKRYIMFNPLYLIGVFRFVLPMAAAPAFAGFLLSATYNAAMLCTTIFSTVYLWNKPIQSILPDELELSGELT